MKRGNFFANLPGPRPGELVEVLLEGAGLTLERIISTGQATPPGRWYEQEQQELRCCHCLSNQPILQQLKNKEQEFFS